MAKRRVPSPTMRGYVRDRVRAGMARGDIENDARSAFPGRNTTVIRQAIREETARRDSVNKLLGMNPNRFKNMATEFGCSGNRATGRVGIEIKVKRADGTSKVYAAEVEIVMGTGSPRRLIEAAAAAIIREAVGSGYTTSSPEDYAKDAQNAAGPNMSGILKLNYIECD